MATRPPQVHFARARRPLRAGLLQLLLTAIGIALGIVLPRIDSGATVATSRTVEVLGAVGFGILGLVSVIYSLLFLVVQSSNTTLTPRLNLFQDDPWIWRTYAIALGLFAFSMTAFLEIGGAAEVTVAVPIFAFVAALAVIVLIRNIQAKAFTSLQMNTTLDRLQRSGREVIDEFYPASSSSGDAALPNRRPPSDGRPVVWTRAQATLQQLDLRQLLEAAERDDAVVVMRVGVGQTIWEKTAIAEVHGPLDDDEVVGSCVIGVDRTFDQDPLLAFRLLADIGLRALSPAVNDPATAVQVIDSVVGLLSRLASRQLDVTAIEAADGVARVHLVLPTWPDFVREGLDELLAGSAESPMVQARAASTLTRLASLCPPDRVQEVAVRIPPVLDASQRSSSTPKRSV